MNINLNKQLKMNFKNIINLFFPVFNMIFDKEIMINLFYILLLFVFGELLIYIVFDGLVIITQAILTGKEKHIPFEEFVIDGAMMHILYLIACICIILDN